LCPNYNRHDHNWEEGDHDYHSENSYNREDYCNENDYNDEEAVITARPGIIND
jgi:hypothetical protein